jgi:hypothetical protein
LFLSGTCALDSGTSPRENADSTKLSTGLFVAAHGLN